MKGLQVDAISHISLEVSDLKRSEEFYHHLLGFEPMGRNLWPDSGPSASFRTAQGQSLILSENPHLVRLPETGAHQAYTTARSSRNAIAEKLKQRGIDIHSYREDRPQEAGDNFYFYDPDGNRIQLVASNGQSAGEGNVQGIDHAAVEVVDLEWAEDFYINILGLPVDHRVGWSTVDYARAKRWGEGKEDMAPGTRRWDSLYSENRRRVPRANSQLFIQFGNAVLGLFLATKHRQEPPEEQAVGSPRVAFRTGRRVLDEVVRLLDEHRKPFQGPVDHPASAPIESSLYFKDPAGNFLELVVPR